MGLGDGEKNNALRDGIPWGTLGYPIPSAGEGGHPIYRQVIAERLALHIEKSSGYGTGDDPFANFTAVARVKGQARFIYPIDRCQEKLTRIYSLIDQGRYGELEEEFKDCASLFDCATAMLREDGIG